MAVFPGLAQAEESSGIQYEPEVPTVPTHESSNVPSAKHHKGSNTQSEAESEASGSNTPNGGGTGGSGGSNTGGGAHNGQSKQGSPGGNGNGGNGSKSAGGGNIGESKPVANSSHPAEESGSSSPLVPILIAIAVLAAISIGAFYFRQRRQGEGNDSPVSPKAS